MVMAGLARDGTPGSSRARLSPLATWEAKEFGPTRAQRPRTKPSELFKRQIYATFQEDHVAMSLIPFFGAGHLLWASDYPHPDSVWPNSRQAIERQMRDLPPDMRRKLTHDDAVALYG